jgi:hypothetical protein
MERPFELLYPVGECTIGQVFELEDSTFGENTEGVDGDSVIERYSYLSDFLNMEANELVTFLCKLGLEKVVREVKSQQLPVSWKHRLPKSPSMTLHRCAKPPLRRVALLTISAHLSKTLERHHPSCPQQLALASSG